LRSLKATFVPMIKLYIDFFERLANLPFWGNKC
jgi:hypothetical protein